MSQQVRVKWWDSKGRRELCREWKPRHYCVGEYVTVQGEQVKIVSASIRWDDAEDVEMQSLGVIPA